MPRPAPKPVMTKAPRREHPYAPDTDMATGMTSDAEPTATAMTDRVVVLPDSKAPSAAAKVFSTRLDPGLVRRLKMHAVEQDRPVQEVVTDALEHWLTRQR